MTEIDGREFTLFWDFDREALRHLPFAGRVQWLRERIELTLLEPLLVLERAENQAFVWLTITELVCAGIEALGGFYGNGRLSPSGKGSSFCRFVGKFMHGDFSEKSAFDAEGNSRTYCEHLEKYFRNGLDHGFAIEWGAILKAEDVPGGYLRPNHNRGIAVCPREFLKDFRGAVERYFERLIDEGEQSVMGQNFSTRFEAVRMQNSRRK